MNIPTATRPNFSALNNVKTAFQIKSYSNSFGMTWSGKRSYTVREFERAYFSGGLIRIFEVDPFDRAILNRAIDVIVTRVLISADDMPATAHSVIGISAGYCILEFDVLNRWNKIELSPEELTFWMQPNQEKT